MLSCNKYFDHYSYHYVKPILLTISNSDKHITKSSMRNVKKIKQIVILNDLFCFNTYMYFVCQSWMSCPFSFVLATNEDTVKPVLRGHLNIGQRKSGLIRQVTS